MYDRIRNRAREAIRHRSYILTLHAEEQMNEDGLSILDIENCILSGSILERQKDFNTGEWKYRINGETMGRENLEVIIKFGATGKLVIMTVYVL
ncbi:MAG: DUF4258 domain-containing protein [Calditrichaceae bacterium]|nr:DUF4258 domain-containing protein [Calditrichaceae bacterium]